MAEEFQNFCLLNTGTIHDQLHYGDGPLQFAVRHYIAIMVRPILLCLSVNVCVYMHVQSVGHFGGGKAMHLLYV